MDTLFDFAKICEQNNKIMNDFFLHRQQSRTFHMKSSRKSTMENKRGFSEIYDQWKDTKSEDLERLKD